MLRLRYMYWLTCAARDIVQIRVSAPFPTQYYERLFGWLAKYPDRSMDDAHPRSLDAFIPYIKDRSEREVHLCVYADNEPIGIIPYTEPDKGTIETCGLCFAPEVHGSGLPREAMIKVLGHWFGTGIHWVIGKYFHDNPISAKFFKSLGAVDCGSYGTATRNGQPVDMRKVFIAKDRFLALHGGGPTESGITFSFTTDPSVIKSVITHPKVWRWLISDDSPPRDLYEPEVGNEHIKFVVAREDGEAIAIFLYVARSPIRWEQHTMVLPAAWGHRASRLFKNLEEWLWDNTSWCKIELRILAVNRAAIAAAKRYGLEEIGVSRRCYRLHGQLMDQALFELSRPIQEGGA